MPDQKSKPASHRGAAFLLCLCALGAADAKDKLDKGVQFDSPQVLDLSSWSVKPTGSAVAVVVLNTSEAKKILAAKSPDEPGPAFAFSEDVYGCKPSSSACSQKHEQALTDATHGRVKRAGKHLSVVPANGAPVVFSDWKMPESKAADGDGETHWYLGRLTGSNYERVEVQFGQDAPGDFLINPASGKVAFVHNGSDVAQQSPDSTQLVTFNADNPPLSLRVAVLDATGPRFGLICAASSNDSKSVPAFKGWHDAHSFDISLDSQDAHGNMVPGTALRFTQSTTGWSLAASDKAQLARIGFECKQPK